MLGANFFAGTPWPASGEIDIMEHIGREPNLVHSTLHAPAYFGGGGFGAPRDLGGPANAAFHIFAVEWDASHMTFLVDGNGFFTVNRDEPRADARTVGLRPPVLPDPEQRRRRRLARPARCGHRSCRRTW